MKMFASARRLVSDGEDGHVKRALSQDMKLPNVDERRRRASSSVRVFLNSRTDLYVGIERKLSRKGITANLKTYNFQANSFPSIRAFCSWGEVQVIGRWEWSGCKSAVVGFEWRSAYRPVSKCCMSL